MKWSPFRCTCAGQCPTLHQIPRMGLHLCQTVSSTFIKFLESTLQPKFRDLMDVLVTVQQKCNPIPGIWHKCWTLSSTAFMRKGNQATTSFYVVTFSLDSVNNVSNVLIAQPCDKCRPKNLPRSKQTDMENSNFRTSRPCALHVAGL